MKAGIPIMAHRNVKSWYLSPYNLCAKSSRLGLFWTLAFATDLNTAAYQSQEFPLGQIQVASPWWWILFGIQYHSHYTSTKLDGKPY